MIRNFSLDSVWLGLIAGILLPPIFLIITYLFKTDEYTVNQFFFFLVTFKVLTKLISLCVVPNLLLFFGFIWTDRLYSARGVLFATILYAMFVLIFRFAI